MGQDLTVRFVRPVSFGPMHKRIETDSSGEGYGGHDVTNNSEHSGRWSVEDKQFRINYLELKAAFLCIQYFCENASNEHIYLLIDNTVAHSNISPKCDVGNYY